MSIEWDEFHERHKRRNFTPAFNAYLLAQIRDTSLDLAVRLNALILRTSWGNFSDHCVHRDGVALSQAGCAQLLGLLDSEGKPDRQKVNPLFQEFERRNLVRFNGREIHPIDDPVSFAKSSLNVGKGPTNREGKAKIPSFTTFIEQVWAAEDPTGFQAYQEVERSYKTWRISLLEKYDAYQKSSERGGTNGDERPEGEGQNVGNGTDEMSETGGANEEGFLNETLKPQSSVSSSSSVSTEQAPRATTTTRTPTPSHRGIAQALRRYGTPDQHIVAELIQNCREQAPDCTEEEIIHFIGAKGSLAKTNPIAFLRTAVPKCFAGEEFELFRDQRRRAAQDATLSVADEIASLERFIEELPDHPQTPEFRKRLAALRGMATGEHAEPEVPIDVQLYEVTELLNECQREDPTDPKIPHLRKRIAELRDKQAATAGERAHSAGGGHR